MDTLQEVLSAFDDPCKKRLDYHHVSAALSQLPDEIRRSFKAQAEILAMDFHESSGKSVWGTYLGPQWEIAKDNGEIICIPDKSEITPEHMSYWVERSSKTRNPVLAIRYKSLIYDFALEVTGHKPNCRDLSKSICESIISAVEGGYLSMELREFKLMDRAVQLALKIHDNDLFETIQDVLWTLDQKYKGQKQNRCQMSHFEIMIKYFKHAWKYELSVLEEQERRLDELEQVALSDVASAVANLETIEFRIDLLCRYYNAKKQPDKVRTTLDRLSAIVRLAIKKKGGIWGQGMIRMVQEKYRFYHLNKEASQLYPDLQALGKQALSDLKPVELTLPLDTIELERSLSDFLSGLQQDVILKYIFSNIPRIRDVRAQIKTNRSYFPLSSMVNSVGYDTNGIPINCKVGKGQDEHYEIVNTLRQNMQIDSIFFRLKVEAMMEKQIFNINVVREMFESSQLIDAEHWDLFDQGMNAYFEGNYVVACHLLVPQFESAIRRLVQLSGGNVLQPDKNPQDGNRYISLDGLLNSQEIKGVFSEDILTYYKTIFTDHNGWNLRNRISHGLVCSSGFNAKIADRIVHAFLILGQVEFTDEECCDDNLGGNRMGYHHEDVQPAEESL